MPYRKKDCRTFSNENLYGENLLFCDETRDGYQVENITVKISAFLRLGMSNAMFANSNITQSEFDKCYLRKCIFRNVDFTGSVFRDCNLDKASFDCCTLKYARFYNCQLDANEIENSLPKEPNLRLDLARNLRANFNQIGDRESAEHFLDIAMSAQEELLKKIITAKTKYYRDNFNLQDRIRSLVELNKLTISKYIWGYGYKIERLMMSYIVFILLFSLTSYLFGFEYIFNNQITKLDFWSNVYFYANALVTSSVSNIVPITLASKVCASVASFTGAIFIAILAAAVFQKISRK